MRLAALSLEFYLGLLDRSFARIRRYRGWPWLEVLEVLGCRFQLYLWCRDGFFQQFDLLETRHALLLYDGVRFEVATPREKHWLTEPTRCRRYHH